MILKRLFFKLETWIHFQDHHPVCFLEKRVSPFDTKLNNDNRA